MNYLKVFTDFAKDIEPLNDAEVGRLFRAMLLYAESEAESDLRGNERYVWGTAKKNIDNQRQSYEKRCEVNRQNATNRYESLRTATNGYENLRFVEEKEKEKEKDKEKNKRNIYSAKFAPPTLDEVSAYCLERNNGIDPQHFIDHYKSNGWKVGRTKMVDWKAAVRTWENKNKEREVVF